jgi:hypothetical protein
MFTHVSLASYWAVVVGCCLEVVYDILLFILFYPDVMVNYVIGAISVGVDVNNY